MVENKAKFFVYIASSKKDRHKGLMFYRDIPDSYGMLFVFDKPGIYPFWMKNTYIPLAIIFIDCDRYIIDIRYGVPLSLKALYPNRKFCFVLEVKYSVFDKLRINIGDRIEIFYY